MKQSMGSLPEHLLRAVKRKVDIQNGARVSNLSGLMIQSHIKLQLTIHQLEN